MNERPEILVVDDIPENLRLLVGILAEREYNIRPASSGSQALRVVQETVPSLILLDIRMPEPDGYDVCRQLKATERTRDIPIIFISALDEPFDKIKAFTLGAVDYITKPFHAQEVLARVDTHLKLWKFRQHLEELVEQRSQELQAAHKRLQNAFEEIQQLKDQLQAENMYLREEIKDEHNFDEIIGQSDALKYLLFKLSKVAATDTTVLITGETGTGKELVARAVHHTSLRGERPLIKVNCASLPAHLIESELFGHEKGAFTGAIRRQIGRFELADGATIFLDEIGELPLELQAKLLRVIQEGEFERLGNSRTLKADVRIIAATNRNLEREIQAGRFRQDLYYRLAVYPLSVPPLRERPEDIPLLVQTFVQRFNKKLGTHVTTVPKTVLQHLQQYAWPGNVRELENIIERAMILSQGAMLNIEINNSSTLPPSPRQTLQEMERDYILKTLDETNGKIYGSDGAAMLLGLNPSTLRGRMRKLNIHRPKNST